MYSQQDRELEESLRHALERALELYPEGPGWEPLWKMLVSRKASIGASAMAAELGLQIRELDAFGSAWRGRIRHPGDDKEGRIALYRLLSWGETIAVRIKDLGFRPRVPLDDDQVLALKRVRAVELILRSLIIETHQGNDALLEYLGTRIPADVLQHWAKVAEPGNILSGTTFSDLASLFIAKDEFPRFAKIFSDDAYLRLLRTKRETVREYLEDIRRLRNTIAHHKHLSDVHTELLDLYYHDLVTPIQSAKDKGAIQTDPKHFFDISKEELTAYFKAVNEDLQAVRDDLGQLRDEMRDGLADLKGTTGRSEEKLNDIERTLKVSWFSRKNVLAYSGCVAALVIAILIFLNFSHKPFSATVQVRGPKGSAHLILSNKGRVILTAPDFRVEAPINEQGEAVFARLPAKLLDGTVQLDVDVPGESYVPRDTAARYSLQRDAQMILLVHLSGTDRLKGIVRDLSTGAPVANATVRIKDITVSSDTSGRFDLLIPLHSQEAFQDVEVTCPGYDYYLDNRVPVQGDGEVSLLLTPMK